MPCTHVSQRSQRCPLCSTELTGGPAIRGRDRLLGLPGEFEVTICPGCSAGVSLPEMDPAALTPYYPSTYGPHSTAQWGLAGAISRLIHACFGLLRRPSYTISKLRALPPGLALDVGCGRGDLGGRLVGLGWSVTGVEPSPEACETASRRGIDARCGEVSDAGLEPSAYDAAILMHSLEHLGDPIGDLRKVVAALRPRALVLVAVPNFGGWQARRFRSRWFHLDLPRHRIHLTPKSLRRALESVGLEVFELETKTTTIGLLASVQYALAGHFLFRTGWSNRVAVRLSAVGFPVAWLLDKLGGGDVLYAAARRR